MFGGLLIALGLDFCLQVLELLRGLDLTPAAETDQEAKAAAAAALDAAADEAVAPLKQQHATALTNATAAARQQALISALNSRIRFSAGKAPLTAAVAAAVIDTAADELTAALADAGAADSGSNAASLSARRLAAERVMGTASVIDSTAAALAAALGEDLAGEDEGSEGLSLGLQKLSDAAAAVQDSAIKVIEVKFNKQPAKAAAAAATEEDDTESTEAAEDKAAAAVAALEEALQAAVAAVAAVAALPGAQGGEGEGEGEGSVTKEGVQSEILKEVDEAVAAVEEKTKTQQETALQVCWTRSFAVFCPQVQHVCVWWRVCVGGGSQLKCGLVRSRTLCICLWDAMLLICMFCDIHYSKAELLPRPLAASGR